MGKTADVQQSIWSDPWFVALSADAKLLYLWAITTDHGNLAGLFTVAQQMIQFEAGLTPVRFTRALESLEGKLAYRAESGAVWVVGRAKNVRSKTTQIAKSIARAVEECPEEDFRRAFVAKYGGSKWLGDVLSHLAPQAESSEPHLNLSEVPSQSQSHSPSQGPSFSSDFDVWLKHYVATTGYAGIRGSKAAREQFTARRKEGWSVEDLELATVGCHGDDFCRSNGHDVPETILRASKVERYIKLGRTGGARTEHKADRRVRELGRLAAQLEGGTA